MSSEERIDPPSSGSPDQDPNQIVQAEQDTLEAAKSLLRSIQSLQEGNADLRKVNPKKLEKLRGQVSRVKSKLEDGPMFRSLAIGGVSLFYIPALLALPFDKKLAGGFAAFVFLYQTLWVVATLIDEHRAPGQLEKAQRKYQELLRRFQD